MSQIVIYDRLTEFSPWSATYVNETAIIKYKVQADECYARVLTGKKRFKNIHRHMMKDKEKDSCIQALLI